MVASLLLSEVELPVGVEVAGSTYRTEAKDGFGTRERPARSCSAHPVLDEVSACALDDAGRDGEAVAKRVGVVHQAGSCAVGEIAAGRVDRLLRGFVERSAIGPPSNGD